MNRGRSKRRVRWWAVLLAVLVVAAIPVALILVPIITHVDRGGSGQVEADADWPTSVSATGDDGRTRSFDVLATQAGTSVDTSALAVGDRIVVSGTGYDSSLGIYVTICRIPDDPGLKPGPCIGGVPEQDAESSEGAVDWAASTWINDAWAWKLFGARSWDDPGAGTFTAYIEVGEPVSDALDCVAERCGLYTRNDHTALGDRSQDLYVPVGFEG